MRRIVRRTAATLLTIWLVAGCNSAPGSPSAGPTHSPAPASPAATSEDRTAEAPSQQTLALLPGAPTADLDAETTARLQAAIDGLVGQGYPDVLAAVMTADGAWAGAAGIDGPKRRLPSRRTSSTSRA